MRGPPFITCENTDVSQYCYVRYSQFTLKATPTATRKKPVAEQNTTNDESPVLTAPEFVALVCGRISLPSTYRAIHRGQIPSLRIGPKLLIPRKALLRFLDGEMEA